MRNVSIICVCQLLPLLLLLLYLRLSLLFIYYYLSFFIIYYYLSVKGIKYMTYGKHMDREREEIFSMSFLFQTVYLHN